MSFTTTTTSSSLHVDFVEQDASDTKEAWRTLIIVKSKGYTCPGVEKLNDSIRTYVWAILGTVFGAQKQFLAEAEGPISSPVDLFSAISRYQDILTYSGYEVNFVFGTGLYMALSDKLLRVDRAPGYNNLIVIATDDQILGLDSGLNVADVLVAPSNASGDTRSAWSSAERFTVASQQCKTFCSTAGATHRF